MKEKLLSLAQLLLATIALIVAVIAVINKSKEGIVYDKTQIRSPLDSFLNKAKITCYMPNGDVYIWKTQDVSQDGNYFEFENGENNIRVNGSCIVEEEKAQRDMFQISRNYHQNLN